VAKPRTTLWYSTDVNGVHFIGLSNIGVEDVFGALGSDQIAWLGKDLSGINHDTPIVVFAHVPLYAVYPPWGWTTTDAAQAMNLLKPFSSVTVLNGHIHQVMQKVEGNVTFHSAMSTAFPQPAPGSAASAGPMKVPAEKLREVLGIRSVDFVAGTHRLAVVDSPLNAA